MDITPLINAGIVIQIHVITAVLALGLGPVIFYQKKGTQLHKRLGKLWAFSMFCAILSANFIFGLRILWLIFAIHLLTLLAAWWLIKAINHARRGRIAAHQKAIKQLYFWSLGVATIFTFWPGRIMSRMFFPHNQMFGFYIVLALFLVIFSAYWLETSKSKAKHKARQ